MKYFFASGTAEGTPWGQIMAYTTMITIPVVARVPHLPAFIHLVDRIVGCQGMTLRLDADWVWDSWPFDDDQGLHHLFFLKAPRSLGDPELRHVNARVGHAVSTDYRTWDILPDVLGPASGPARMTGQSGLDRWCKLRSGGFHLFYTACSRAEDYRVQRIGRATPPT